MSRPLKSYPDSHQAFDFLIEVVSLAPFIMATKFGKPRWDKATCCLLNQVKVSSNRRAAPNSYGVVWLLWRPARTMLDEHRRALILFRCQQWWVCKK